MFYGKQVDAKGAIYATAAAETARLRMRPLLASIGFRGVPLPQNTANSEWTRGQVALHER